MLFCNLIFFLHHITFLSSLHADLGHAFYMFLTHSSPDGHLECFQFSATKNGAHNEHPPVQTHRPSWGAHIQKWNELLYHMVHMLTILVDTFRLFLIIFVPNSLAPVVHNILIFT